MTRHDFWQCVYLVAMNRTGDPETALKQADIAIHHWDIYMAGVQ